MKNLFILLTILSVFNYGCKNEKPALIENPSAEITDGSVVAGWTYNTEAKDVIHYFDNEAHHGNKSLFIHADRIAKGRWSSKVQLKPWSEYRFTGWIKTENLVSESGEGAGFKLDGLVTDFKGLKGTNDWTAVSYKFNTGANDCVTLSCMLDIKSGAKGRAWFDDMSMEYISSEKISTEIKINTAATSEPMPVYIYGQFIEHLGKCIYGGIWAEMLEDRKFWYGPGAQDSPWIVSGEKEMFSMDAKEPFTGAQTPILEADGLKKSILSQENLGLKENLGYEGRIILKSTDGIEKAIVSLKWDGKTEIVEITDIGKKYTTYPLKFKSTELVHDAVLSIEPVGKGKLWVGTVSLMPSDNIDGFRSDVINLLFQLNSPVYRWPGGNFVSGYNWRDGIGDRDKRPPRKNPAWLGVEANDVGIHEFMKFCEILNTEPYIAVNAGLGSASEAMAEVQYTNGDVNTPMGKLRAANGHDQPWA